MTIAWLLGHYPSVSETFIARDIAALRSRGFDVQVWAAWEAGEGARLVPHLPYILRAFPKQAYSAHGQYWAHKCRGELATVTHIHAGWGNNLAWMARSAAQRLGVSWSFSAHARDVWVEGGDLRGKLRDASFALCCTRAGSEHLARLGDAAKVIYAPHGLDVAALAFVEWQPTDERQVVSVGRLVPKKRLRCVDRSCLAVALGGHQRDG
jgi:glycosyltransferase involved in cell wall biosynthesis